MPAPRPRFRKDLSAPGLLHTIRHSFAAIPDLRRAGCPISLPAALMSGLALLGWKYPSLLKFEEAYQAEAIIRANLKMRYGVDRAPCDTPLRTILDPVDPAQLRPALRAGHRHLQRHKALEAYPYLDGPYVVSLNGTGQFASSQLSCPDCGVKTRQGHTSYYHQLLAAVFVHPDLKTVLPLVPEAITR